jgi:NADH:ubiquinone oxidoreductase subunit 3 (subunit A)
MKQIQKIALLFLLAVSYSATSIAQCSMCRAVVESDITGKGAGINNAIVYLMAFPYVLIATLAIAFVYKMRKDKVRFSA